MGSRRGTETRTELRTFFRERESVCAGEREENPRLAEQLPPFFGGAGVLSLSPSV